ncbi:hypothetical protein SLS60_011447 [Paraconiothyrium brasiliense]|uniref:F-box domain-containing protein n=1 Tax=Paraconiothyrium brasiliense TaxID=300254 RepID=A0ABR3QK94_9PLEO
MAPILTLMSLSIELVHKIVFHVARRADLAVLRLTSQMMNTISNPYYFATAPIFPDWDEDSKSDPPFPNEIEYDVRNFANIINRRKAEDIEWFPKVDFRGVLFAQLETLALGQIMFSDDHHFKWIIDHATTLQEIYFDHCSVLYQSGASQELDDWLDDEGYPKIGRQGEHWGHGYSELPEDDAEKVLIFESYAFRWLEAFTLFSASLPRLRIFRFGTSSQWKFDQPNRRDDGEPGHPIMPWEGERDIKNELFRERYLI